MARMILSPIVPCLLTSSQGTPRRPNDTPYQNRRTTAFELRSEILQQQTLFIPNNSTAILSWVYSLRRSID
ncbi:hypothetical protein F5J12DRAFT_858790, partial [Pisolithus orientalis]|uniref:uncharacterized protein n=1 Tax=Pisolithus orientalis TaxID=936130 RepID=UPI00222440CD